MRYCSNSISVDFHLVIPSFEESNRLPLYLIDLAAKLKGQPYKTNILVVDDGSRAEEKQKIKKIVSELRESHNLILDPVFLKKNMGKGFAVRTGWRQAQNSKWLAFADADGATSADEVLRVFDRVYAENDVRKCYLGSRIRMLGHSVQRHWKRHVIGRLYAALVGIIINEAIYDSQCGFKVISQQAFQTILPFLQENRFAFDIEMIAALSDSGFQLEEIPIDWNDIPGSRVSLLKDSYRMFNSLFHIQKRRKRWTL